MNDTTPRKQGFLAKQHEAEARNDELALELDHKTQELQRTKAALVATQGELAEYKDREANARTQEAAQAAAAPVAAPIPSAPVTGRERVAAAFNQQFSGRRH